MAEVEFVKQSVECTGLYGSSERIESAARTCTDTEVGNDSDAFVSGLVSRGEVSPTEFGYAEFLVTADRGIQQELTRHRHLSFLIESSRWINYGKRVFRYIVDPVDGWDVPDAAVERLKVLCHQSAECYEDLLELGAPRDYARKALLLCTASNIKVAGNPRTWSEMLEKRLKKRVHPEFRSLARSIKDTLAKAIPPVFGD